MLFQHPAKGGKLNRLIPFALIALVAAVLVLQVLLRPALPVDETRALSVAWEMHISGNPFLLTGNVALCSHKLPLLYWLINLLWLAIGPSELAARLVGPAMALIGLALTARLARRFWPGDTTLNAGAIMVPAGFTFFSLFAGTTMFEALLTLPVLLGALAIWRIGQGQGGRDVFLALGLAFGIGVLAKGPAAFIHLLSQLLSLPLWAPTLPDRAPLLRGLGLALGIALALVAVWLVPALIMMHAATRLDLLWSQSANRVAGSLGHGRSVWFLLALLPVLPGHLTIGLGLALALHALVALTYLAPGFSAQPIADRLASFAPQGIAVVGMPYQAEFNFAARLTARVATPAPDALSGWKAAHPGGVVAGPVATAGIPDAPAETFRFRGQDFGLWPVH